MSGRTVGVYLSEETYERAAAESSRTGVSIGRICGEAVRVGLGSATVPESVRAKRAQKCMREYQRLEAHLNTRLARSAIDLGDGVIGYAPGALEAVEGLRVELEAARQRWIAAVGEGA